MTFEKCVITPHKFQQIAGIMFERSFYDKILTNDFLKMEELHEEQAV